MIGDIAWCELQNAIFRMGMVEGVLRSPDDREIIVWLQLGTLEIARDGSVQNASGATVPKTIHDLIEKAKGV